MVARLSLRQEDILNENKLPEGSSDEILASKKSEVPESAT